MTDKSGHQLKLSVNKVKAVGHQIHDRISDDAARQMAHSEEDRIKKKWRLAKVMAEHAGRQTIQEEDVRLVENMEEEL